MTKARSLSCAQEMVQEAVAGIAFLIQNSSLAHAGVDQQAQAQRSIGFAGEIIYGLWAAVFFQGEIVFLEIRR